MNNNKVIIIETHSSVCPFFNHRPEHLIAIRTWSENKLEYSDVFPIYLPVLLPEWSENIATQLHMAITEDVITTSSELLHLWCVHAFLCAFVRASINWKFVQKTTTTGFYPTCSASTSYLIWLYNLKKNFLSLVTYIKCCLMLIDKEQTTFLGVGGRGWLLDRCNFLLQQCTHRVWNVCYENHWRWLSLEKWYAKGD